MKNKKYGHKMCYLQNKIVISEGQKVSEFGNDNSQNMANQQIILTCYMIIILSYRPERVRNMCQMTHYNANCTKEILMIAREA